MTRKVRACEEFKRKRKKRECGEEEVDMDKDNVRRKI